MLSPRKHLGLIALGCAGALLLSTAIASADDVVGKIAGAKQGFFAGKPRMILTIAPPGGGKPVQVGLPLKDENHPEQGPREDMATLVKGFKPGDVVKVTSAAGGTPPAPIMSAIVAYALKPGEDEPNAFLFKQTYDRKEGKQTTTIVEVRRFEQPVLLAIPNHKDKGGDMQPDPEMVAVANSLKEGDVVLVDVAGGGQHPTLKHIELYTAPQNGKVVKIDDPADLDGNKSASIDIDADGKTVTAFVPGKTDGKKFTIDSKIMAELKRVKKDAEVTFRTSDENGKTFLRAITITKAAPHAAASSSTDKPEKPEKPEKPAK